MYHVTPKSKNAKTGDIATTTSTRNNCPDTCPLKGSGCYASGGPMAIHWRHVTNGTRGTDLDGHVAELKALEAPMVRLNQAGDLPFHDWDGAARILNAAAHNGRVAWTYTHHRSFEFARTLNRRTHATVNMSANSLADVDSLPEDVPVCTIVPEDWQGNATPGGRKVVVCPATRQKGFTCKDCGKGSPLCWRKYRDFVVAFPVHGSQKKKAAAVAAAE